MEATHAGKRGLRVAVTGASGDFGRLLLPLLEQDPAVVGILVLDVAGLMEEGMAGEPKRA